MTSGLSPKPFIFSNKWKTTRHCCAAPHTEMAELKVLFLNNKKIKLKNR